MARLTAYWDPVPQKKVREERKKSTIGHVFVVMGRQELRLIPTSLQNCSGVVNDLSQLVLSSPLKFRLILESAVRLDPKLFSPQHSWCLLLAWPHVSLTLAGCLPRLCLTLTLRAARWNQPVGALRPGLGCPLSKMVTGQSLGDIWTGITHWPLEPTVSAAPLHWCISAWKPLDSHVVTVPV